MVYITLAIRYYIYKSDSWLNFTKDLFRPALVIYAL